MLANCRSHGKTQIGVNIDLANGHGGSLAQLILRHTDGAGHIAAVLVNFLHKLLRNRGRTVQHNGETRQALGDLLQHVKAQLRLGAGLELVCTVAGTDGNGQGVAAGLGDEFLNLLGMRVGGILGTDLHFILNAGQSAKLRFHDNAVVMGILHHLAGDLNVFRERFGGGVDHHRGKAVLNAGLAGLKAVTVIQMQHDRQACLNNSSLYQLFQIGTVGIGTRTLGYLKDQGSFQIGRSLSDALNDLHVVDVESTYGITTVIGLFKHFLRSYQRHNHISFTIKLQQLMHLLFGTFPLYHIFFILQVQSVYNRYFTW